MDEKASDDLEITSIGSLYSGHWEKKYWSSSRGKDRYPYPVGYLAVRTYAGNKYRMEIHEGLKGPLFVVTSPDGDSSTGLTPDIAWEHFQKKSCPKVRNWLGKRFSSKIDGVELFGFRNPFVQRLLRELVANISGVAEKSLITPTTCNNVSNVDQEKNEKPDIFPDLLPFLRNKQTTKKRSTKSRNSVESLVKEPRIKRTCSQVLLHAGECSSPKNSKQEGGIFSVSKDKNAVYFEEEHNSICKFGPAIQDTSSRIRNSPGAFEIVNNKTLDRGSKYNGKPVDPGSQSQVISAKYEKFSDAMLEERCFLPLPKLGDGEHVESVTYPDVFIPDTCDIEKDNAIDSQLEGQKGNLCSMKNDELLTGMPVDILQKGVIKDSLPEFGSSSGSSNPSSEKFDLDSAGQELARSMMAFLLPRAVPLLTKTYVKRRSKHRNRDSKNGPRNNVSKAVDHEKMNAPEALPCNDSLCHVTTEPFIENGNSKDKCYVPDSFEGDQFAHVANVNIQYPPSFDEVQNALLDGTKGNIKSPILPDGSENENREENLPSHKFMPRPSSTTENTEHCPSWSSSKAAEEVLKTDIAQAPMFCFTTKDNDRPNDQLNCEVDATLNFEDDNVRNQVGAPHITHLENDNREDMIVKHDPFFICEPQTTSLVAEIQKTDEITSHSSKKYIPQSETAVCRKYINSSSPEFPLLQKLPGTNDAARYTGSDADTMLLVTNNKVNVDEEIHQTSVHAPIIADSDACDQAVVKNVTKDIKPAYLIDSSVSKFMECDDSVEDIFLPGKSRMRSHSQIPDKSHIDNSLATKENLNLDTRDSMELVGSILHPSPVLSMSLTSKEDSLQISVLCGLVDSNIRNLYIYVFPVQEYRGDCPSFLGYTSLMLSPNDMQCQYTPAEKSGLQFIVGRQSIVILDSIKAPHCRDQNFDCSCTDCTSYCSEEYAVEIVQVNFGYVSSVTRLLTTERVSSILVCEPNYLVAVKQSGKLHAWVMNLEWSVDLKEFMLPQFDELSHTILELKTIPNCNSLIIGHNGLGTFALWDISKQVLVAKFSSPRITTFQILPIGLSKWQNDASFTTWCPKADDERSITSIRENMAVWLLVSANTDTNAPHQAKTTQTVPIGCWRLGLLFKNMVILDSILDPRASAVGTSMHYGIYGTRDGLLYKWELSSGDKLSALHWFKCGSVTHIATDTKSGAIAVVDNGRQLLLYAQP